MPLLKVVCTFMATAMVSNAQAKAISALSRAHSGVLPACTIAFSCCCSKHFGHISARHHYQQLPLRHCRRSVAVVLLGARVFSVVKTLICTAFYDFSYYFPTIFCTCVKILRIFRYKLFSTKNLTSLTTKLR